jgi:hypothetical protein
MYAIYIATQYSTNRKPADADVRLKAPGCPDVVVRLSSANFSRRLMRPQKAPHILLVEVSILLD